MELWDLYDKDRTPLHRTHPRGTPLPEGAYHVAVIVVVVNSKGQVLLTRRAPEKDACPGWWENTGGSVLAGDTSLQAIQRELREETGIRVQPQELTLLGTECLPRVFLDIYAVKKPVLLSQLVFQPGETDAAQWMDFSQWRDLAGKGAYLTPSWQEREEDSLFSRMEAFFREKLDTPAQQG